MNRPQKEDNSPKRRTRRWDVAVTNKKIWVSELLSIIFLCILLTALLYVTSTIVNNEITIQNNDRKIAALKTENINLARNMETMRERDRLVNILTEVVGNRMKPATIHTLADLIYQNSRQYGYAPELLLAVIAVESRFDPAALGRYRSGNLSGALGLMQIKFNTAQEVAITLGMTGLQPEDLLDPEINMILGTAYLTTLIARFQSFKLGILAYNLGPGTVRGTLSRREQLPTQYYNRVLEQYYRFKGMAMVQESGNV